MEIKTKEELRSISNKDLIIIITTSNCFLIVIDNISSSYISYSVCKSIDEITFGDLQFDNVKAFVLSDHYTTIPSALFDENNAKDYLQFTTSINESDTEVKYDIVNSEKLVIIWGLEKTIKTKLTHLFSGVSFQNIMTPFLKSINRDRNAINTLFFGDKLLVSVFKEEDLQLINCFDIKSVEDALYYHLLLLQSTDLLEDEVALTNGGFYKEMKTFNTKLKMYFSDIKNYVSIDSINAEEIFILEFLKITV